MHVPYKKGTYVNFGNVRRPILRKPIRRRAVWRPIWKKSRLNWKLKMSNTADNADINQHVTLGIVEPKK